MTTAIYNGLRYTTREINFNFRIKVAGIDATGRKINKLLGVAGLIELIGIDLANKFFGRALKSLEDRIICKLRRGLKVTFYVK